MMWSTLVISLAALLAVTAARPGPDFWDNYRSYVVEQGDDTQSLGSGEAVTVVSSSAGQKTTTVRVDSPSAEEDGTDVCMEPVRVGVCRAAIERWAFDKKTRRCRFFPWGGCGGTGNNFPSEADCRAQCGRLMPTADACEEPADCADDCDLWRDTDTGCLHCRCSGFNRYPTVGNSPSFGPVGTGGSIGGSGVCQLPVEQGPCRAALRRFASSGGVCREFIYGGCRGNSNNFETLAECQRTCAAGGFNRYPTVGNSPSFGPVGTGGSIGGSGICQRPIQQGPCKAAFKRYAYSGGVCREFIYGGCEGNSNNFVTLAECQQTCAAGGRQGRGNF